jgi:RNA-directed DNA polymerase
MPLIKNISQSLEMSEQDILKIISRAPKRYKIYAIPKRDGVGSRIIAQPARELKAIQRYLVENVLNTLPVHRAATAYVVGKNIRDNANAHKRGNVLLKLDFKDFFHSLAYQDLAAVFIRNEFKIIERSEWKIMDDILFWLNPFTGAKCLSIGAPSSPLVSNLIMQQIDDEISKAIEGKNVIYTRYADDITLSSNRIEVLLESEKEIRRLIERTKRPTLCFNEDKRGIYTSAGRRIVTGLVITPDKKVSLGRERKRAISAAIHHIKIRKDVSADHLAKTKGWLAFALSVEPTFVRAMHRKYGPLVRRIMRTETPPRATLAQSRNIKE